MAMGRSLIVNADDFGRSHGINRGVIEAYEQGIVTSASLMVRGAAARVAAAYGRAHPELSLGLHVDLGEWIYRDGEWRTLYAVVPCGDAEAVPAELERQLDTFREMVGGDPTHLDSHQHVHREEPVRSSLTKLAGELAVPLRGVSPGLHHCGAFHGRSRKGIPCHERMRVGCVLLILSSVSAGLSELVRLPGVSGGQQRQ